jgi:hypothetical protein
MPFATPARTSFAVVTGALALACFSSSSGGGSPRVSFDAGVGDVSLAFDTGAHDAGSQADAGSCIPSMATDGNCTDLDEVGQTVTGTCGTSEQPMGTGGTIADGTYALTGRVGYQTGCMEGTFRATLRMAGGCFLRVDDEGNGSATEHLSRSGTFTTSGSTLTRDVTCGTALPAATYTATPTTFTIFDEGGAVTVWTKQ